MPITNPQSGTRVDEIADGVYRIHTPLPDVPGGFSFNQYLLVDEDPLLFHTGPRSLFPLVREALESVLPPARLRWIAFSHNESDENGSLTEFLALAPRAEPLSGRIYAMVNDDLAPRRTRALADGETLSLGRNRVRWFDAPHVPHAWECGFLFEERTHTLLSGDLFTQGGSAHPPVTESDLLGPSEAFRKQLDYASHSPLAPAVIERLAETRPTTLACMHGAAFRGDGAALLRGLAAAWRAEDARLGR